VDVSRAQLSNTGNEVILTDSRWPWTIRVQMWPNAERPEVKRLTIEACTDQPITSTVLTQIPVRQIAQVAASALQGEGEAQYRMLARPRPEGSRSWPEDHYRRVAMVAAWARATGRAGGAAGAVSEFWGVHFRTARRWLAHLQQVEGQPSRQSRSSPGHG
jgi:hypothetical protein